MWRCSFRQDSYPKREGKLKGSYNTSTGRGSDWRPPEEKPPSPPMRRAFNFTRARYIAFQLTEVSMSPQMFAENLGYYPRPVGS